MHHVIEYEENSYLVSLFFAEPFLLFIIFSTCSSYFFNTICHKSSYIHNKYELVLTTDSIPYKLNCQYIKILLVRLSVCV